MPTDNVRLDTRREIVGALLTRLGRIAAAAETLRAITDHTHGELSPSLPPLLESLDRDLRLASGEIGRLKASLPPSNQRRTS